VVLQLDGDSLELSDECKNDLAAISTNDQVQSFKRKYGMIRVVLSVQEWLNMLRDFFCNPC
jgi:hypothetical protein